MNRSQKLVAATVLLLVAAVAHHVWANWGLVTIHAKGMPLSRVIGSMARQGHARIETDLAGDTPVTVYFDKLPLPEALERVTAVTDSRWRLLFFAAPDKSAIRAAEVAWFGGQRPDGWQMMSFPMGGSTVSLGDDDTAPLDPRGDLWTPRTAAPAPVQTFFKEAAQVTNASFAFPAIWNPTVSSAPKAGIVASAAPELIRKAGGREDEIFFLSKTNRRPPRNGDDNGDEANEPDMALLTERTQNEINRLPPAERAQAQSVFDTGQAFWKSLQGLSEADREAALQKHFMDPNVLNQISNRVDQRESMMSHQQRLQHYQNYVSRKLTAMGKL
ncbi:MAG TPA: hypothetical protein VHY22_03270 [Chthoniobacteraceae bacterium]|nr:hypothetical protein [Chthoniobacteraceae bacterium]